MNIGGIGPLRFGKEFKVGRELRTGEHWERFKTSFVASANGKIVLVESPLGKVRFFDLQGKLLKEHSPQIVPPNVSSDYFLRPAQVLLVGEELFLAGKISLHDDTVVRLNLGTGSFDTVFFRSEGQWDYFKKSEEKKITGLSVHNGRLYFMRDNKLVGLGGGGDERLELQLVVPDPDRIIEVAVADDGLMLVYPDRIVFSDKDGRNQRTISSVDGYGRIGKITQAAIAKNAIYFFDRARGRLVGFDRLTNRADFSFYFGEKLVHFSVCSEGGKEKLILLLREFEAGHGELRLFYISREEMALFSQETADPVLEFWDKTRRYPCSILPKELIGIVASRLRKIDDRENEICRMMPPLMALPVLSLPMLREAGNYDAVIGVSRHGDPIAYALSHLTGSDLEQSQPDIFTMYFTRPQILSFGRQLEILLIPDERLRELTPVQRIEAERALVGMSFGKLTLAQAVRRLGDEFLVPLNPQVNASYEGGADSSRYIINNVMRYVLCRLLEDTAAARYFMSKGRALLVDDLTDTGAVSLVGKTILKLLHPSLSVANMLLFHRESQCADKNEKYCLLLEEQNRHDWNDKVFAIGPQWYPGQAPFSSSMTAPYPAGRYARGQGTGLGEALPTYRQRLVNLVRRRLEGKYRIADFTADKIDEFIDFSIRSEGFRHGYFWVLPLPWVCRYIENLEGREAELKTMALEATREVINDGQLNQESGGILEGIRKNRELVERSITHLLSDPLFSALRTFYVKAESPDYEFFQLLVRLEYSRLADEGFEIDIPLYHFVD